MSKGEDTRQRIVERAFLRAGKDGLGGLSIGVLADELKLSKSGLFAHFGSKEELQLEVLREGVKRFEEKVGKPALKAARGLPRLKKLFELWLQWSSDPSLPGGCLFIPAAFELDDQEGRPRDFLVATQKQLLSFLSGAARLAVAAGQLKQDTDCELFAHEAYGIVLAFNHNRRLLRDPQALSVAHRSFERLLRSVQS